MSIALTPARIMTREEGKSYERLYALKKQTNDLLRNQIQDIYVGYFSESVSNIIFRLSIKYERTIVYTNDKN